MSKHLKRNAGKAPKELQLKHDNTPMVDCFIVLAPTGVESNNPDHIRYSIGMVQVPDGRRTDMDIAVEKGIAPIGVFYFRNGPLTTALFNPAMEDVFREAIREYLLRAKVDGAFWRK
jgi:hypothetical protein